MNLALRPDLERRLQDEALRQARPASELVEEALRRYLDAPPDDPTAVVRGVRGLLPGAWPAEDFSDWQPPQ